ncbi:MAG: Ig-like domain-containing protein, partial [Acidimicrobiales bacterium]
MLHSRRNTRNWSIGAAAAVVVAAGAVGVGVGVRGGSGSGTSTHAVAASKAGGDQSAARAAAAQAQLTSAVTFSPAGSTTAVPLDAPVSVQTGLGTIRDISVQPTTGPALTGAVAQGGQRWVSAGPLAPSTTYTISGTVGSGPTQAPFHSTFTTVTPTALVTDALLPNDGTTVGVGQPVVVKFTKNIPAASQAAVLSHFTVTETVPVAGGWHWFSS